MLSVWSVKLRCDERFTHVFTACVCGFKVIALVWANQGNYFENATACSKRTMKTTVATQLKAVLQHFLRFHNISQLSLFSYFLLFYPRSLILSLQSLCFISLHFSHYTKRNNFKIIFNKNLTLFFSSKSAFCNWGWFSGEQLGMWRHSMQLAPRLPFGLFRLLKKISTFLGLFWKVMEKSEPTLKHFIKIQIWIIYKKFKRKLGLFIFVDLFF